ncbi:hypothetical protein PINS_up023093 [Pythium insidiosum]|nr:hypothetical protein PINS_up023093 [Pythium insidiosum]
MRTRVITRPTLVEGIPPAIVGKRYETSSQTIAIIIISRLVYAAIAAMMARHARQVLPEYNKNQLRNVLMSIYVVGLIAFTIPQGLLWRRCYFQFISTSTSYVHLCLDTVLAMFLVSNGGSILHRQAVVFNIIALAIVTSVTVVCLSMYLEGVKANKNTEEYRIELAALEKVYGYNEKFQTMYPMVLTYLSVIANIYAAFSVEFFTRRQIWLKTMTQFETPPRTTTCSTRSPTLWAYRPGGFLQTGVGRSLLRAAPFGERPVWSNNPMLKLAVVRGHRRLQYDSRYNMMQLHDAERDPKETTDLFEALTDEEKAEMRRLRTLGRRLNRYFRVRWDRHCLTKVRC